MTLANVISLLHHALIVFVVATPFIKTVPWSVLSVHFSTCISLLVHWYYNNDVCFLTFLESQLRGVPMEASLIHAIVSPVYNIQDKDIAKVSKVVTWVVAGFSAYRLYTEQDVIKSELYKFWSQR